MAIKSVREHFTPEGCPGNANDAEQKKHPGQFTYTPYQAGTPAMVAAGIVCMQEFGQYDDWRIGKSLEKTIKNIDDRAKLNEAQPNGRAPFNDAYTLYYVSQALYQVGGEPWRSHYPALRDYLVKSQIREPNNPLRMACGNRAIGSAAGLAKCTSPPWPASCWPSPIVTCRSCRKERSKVCKDGSASERVARKTRRS